MLRLNGITPVMATTFNPDESIDDDALRRQIDFAIEAGAAAVCGPGFGAEFYKMSDAERYHFVDVLVEHTRKRIPVIAATSCGSTHSTIEFSRYAERVGADCLMVTAPRTAALPAPEIIGHYSKLCDAVGIPLMLQDADFTGAGLPARVFTELARQHPNFLFAKLEVTLPGQKCAEIVQQTGGQVQVIYGLGGVAMLDGLAHGASAMMPGAAASRSTCASTNFTPAGAETRPKRCFTGCCHISLLRSSTLRSRSALRKWCWKREAFFRTPECASQALPSIRFTKPKCGTSLPMQSNSR